MVRASFFTAFLSVFLISSLAFAEELSFFRSSYQDSRAQFLRSIESLQAQGVPLEHKALQVPSLKDPELFTDVLYLPPTSGKKQRLLILVSGIHGVEGFVGSALQNLFIAENFFQKKDENLGILLIHALNPYGFKFNRRVSENNVDLNRNFDTSDLLFQLRNEGYQKVRDLLNPTLPADFGFWDRMGFYSQCVKAIIQYSMDSLRRAILKGQYEVENGIYFGGFKAEPQKALLEKELLDVTTGYQHVVMVDLHTGYGKRGHLHLFADRAPDMDAKYIAEVFKGLDLDYGQKKDFYEATGGLVVYGAKLLKSRTRYAGMVFEFGTLDSQKTAGSLDSLYRMVRENQSFQFGAATPQEDKEIKESFLELFYPQDPEWRTQVVEQFRHHLSVTLENQKALK